MHDIKQGKNQSAREDNEAREHSNGGSCNHFGITRMHDQMSRETNRYSWILCTKHFAALRSTTDTKPALKTTTFEGKTIYNFPQLVFLQEYLHSVGIAHRDIKPENILLTETDQLKLTDFGLATVFRHKGKERRLERACGTFPYMAPEVLTKSDYPAEPSDIWCCGVVLLAMLIGGKNMLGFFSFSVSSGFLVVVTCVVRAGPDNSLISKASAIYHQRQSRKHAKKRKRGIGSVLARHAKGEL